jgi:sugar/nucleoside kinase (ribokinase family)
MFDACVIGHVVQDFNTIQGSESAPRPGGTAYYAAMAYRGLGLDTAVITSLATEHESALLGELRDSGVEVFNLPSPATTVFHNSYDPNDPDIRVQRVSAQAAPIDLAHMPQVPARIYHLGPLTQKDMDPEIPRACAETGTLVALDAQGLTRSVVNGRVVAAGYAHARHVLPNIRILKADADEILALTGRPSVIEAVQDVARAGVQEVIVTRGGQGSSVHGEGRTVDFGAVPPRATVDATGCGDTYLAAYLARRLTSDDLEDCARHAALAASLNIEVNGAFTGSWDDIAARWQAFREACGYSVMPPTTPPSK